MAKKIQDYNWLYSFLRHYVDLVLKLSYRTIRYVGKDRIPKDGGSHMCLIVGYNEETEEIAVSNSWGDNDMQPAWVPLRLAKRVSYGHMYSVGAKR